MKDFQEVALRKDGELYLFRFDRQSRPALLGVLGRFAANAELNFSWHDAAAVCRRSRDAECNPVAPAQAKTAGERS